MTNTNLKATTSKHILVTSDKSTNGKQIPSVSTVRCGALWWNL